MQDASCKPRCAASLPPNRPCTPCARAVTTVPSAWCSSFERYIQPGAVHPRLHCNSCHYGYVLHRQADMGKAWQDRKMWGRAVPEEERPREGSTGWEAQRYSCCMQASRGCEAGGDGDVHTGCARSPREQAGLLGATERLLMHGFDKWAAETHGGAVRVGMSWKLEQPCRLAWRALSRSRCEP